MFVSLLEDSAHPLQAQLLKFFMHIYILAETYIGWMTTEHSFGRPKGK